MKPKNTEGKIAPLPCASGKHVLGTCVCKVNIPTPDQLFATAFSKETARQPRSREYRDGVMALLRHQIDGVPFSCIWHPGSPQSDAFYSGVEEGWQILRKYGLPQHKDVSLYPDMSDDLLLDNFHWSKPDEPIYELFRAELVHRLNHRRWPFLQKPKPVKS